MTERPTDSYKTSTAELLQNNFTKLGRLSGFNQYPARSDIQPYPTEIIEPYIRNLIFYIISNNIKLSGQVGNPDPTLIITLPYKDTVVNLHALAFRVLVGPLHSCIQKKKDLKGKFSRVQQLSLLGLLSLVYFSKKLISKISSYTISIPTIISG